MVWHNLSREIGGQHIHIIKQQPFHQDMDKSMLAFSFCKTIDQLTKGQSMTNVLLVTGFFKVRETDVQGGVTPFVVRH